MTTGLKLVDTRRDAGSLCYIIDQWLDDEPLPLLVSEDPLVEDDKVKALKKLFVALNP